MEVEPVVFNGVLGGVGSGEGDRCCGRLLHHIAEGAREPEATLVGRRCGCFDEEDVAPDRGVGETGGDPIKLYEYWAAGKQVVSTRIDGMEAWSEVLMLVDESTEAVAAISGLLDGSISLPRPSVPAGRTWRRRSRRISARSCR